MAADDVIERLECPKGHGAFPVRINDDDVPRCGRYPDGAMCRAELAPVRYVRESEVDRLEAALRLDRDSWKHKNERDNAHLLGEVERLRVALRAVWQAVHTAKAMMPEGASLDLLEAADRTAAHVLRIGDS